MDSQIRRSEEKEEKKKAVRKLMSEGEEAEWRSGSTGPSEYPDRY
jgi:hypothetical protein